MASVSGEQVITGVTELWSSPPPPLTLAVGPEEVCERVQVSPPTPTDLSFATNDEDAESEEGDVPQVVGPLAGLDEEPGNEASRAASTNGKNKGG